MGGADAPTSYAAAIIANIRGRNELCIRWTEEYKDGDRQRVLRPPLSHRHITRVEFREGWTRGVSIFYARPTVTCVPAARCTC